MFTQWQVVWKNEILIVNHHHHSSYRLVACRRHSESRVRHLFLAFSYLRRRDSSEPLNAPSFALRRRVVSGLLGRAFEFGHAGRRSCVETLRECSKRIIVDPPDHRNSERPRLFGVSEADNGVIYFVLLVLYSYKTSTPTTITTTVSMSSFKAEEEEVAAAETYSQSSHDEEEEEDDEVMSLDGEAEDEQEVPFWRQHWLALMVALIAAVASHRYNNASGSTYLFPYAEPSTSKHAHVAGFLRTANISFCNGDQYRLGPPAKDSLELMDFYIPREHFDALQAFYQADAAEDDLYEQLEYSNTPLQNPDLQCLVQQLQRPHASGKFKGITYFFRQPSMEDIYPEEVDNSGVAVGVPISAATSMSRKRRLQQPPLVFTGFAGKFVNLSPKPVLLYWDGKGGHEKAKKLVGEIAPFESIGTATMPGHSFHVTPIFDSSTALQRWVITADTALVYYEPQTPEELRHTLLVVGVNGEPDYAAWAKYQRQLINQVFARDYLIASKRTWLGHFPRRFPMHFMHEAKYIGQTHQMEDFSLEVVSVTPRVLVIDNFLSAEECQSIIRTSQEQGLQHSTLHSGASAKQTRDLSTRSSSNTWLPRDTNALTERIYQQAAQVMGLDPELFQKYHDSSPHHHSIAESLQVVRYKKGGEEYQPHHDFVYPSINHRYQPTRFATLLLYLNDVPTGGETRFPRAVNNYNAEGLELKPKAGRALLFYNLLDDGNVDDLSQHGSNPTQDHEKWLANLWVWDPVIG